MTPPEVVFASNQCTPLLGRYKLVGADKQPQTLSTPYIMVFTFIRSFLRRPSSESIEHVQPIAPVRAPPRRRLRRIKSLENLRTNFVNGEMIIVIGEMQRSDSDWEYERMMMDLAERELDGYRTHIG